MQPCSIGLRTLWGATTRSYEYIRYFTSYIMTVATQTMLWTTGEIYYVYRTMQLHGSPHRDSNS